MLTSDELAEAGITVLAMPADECNTPTAKADDLSPSALSSPPSVRGLNFGFGFGRRSSRESRASGATSNADQAKPKIMRLFTMDQDVELRAVSSGVALRGNGSMFRGSGSRAFDKSVIVEEIDDFWSHSWSASHTQKVMTLLVHYNGLKSFFAGIAAAFASLVLPLPLTDDPDSPLQFLQAGCALFCGLPAALAALYCLPSGRHVFLDKACIRQDDEHAKRQGIMSLGNFLQRSASMLVLWDASYFSRLWCVFEIAARLKLLEGDPRTNAIKMRPVVHGAMVLWLVAMVFLPLAVVSVLLPCLAQLGIDARSQRISGIFVFGGCFFFALAVPGQRVLGQHISAIRNLRHQTESFSIAEAKCFCCSAGHLDPATGQRIDCDRRLVEQSVQSWFGSKESFDAYVRRDLRRQVPLRSPLPYHYVIMGCMPMVWFAIGLSGWQLRRGQYGMVAFHASAILGMWLFVIPAALVILTKAFSSTFRESMGFCGTIRCVLLAFFSAVPVMLSIFACEYHFGLPHLAYGPYALFLLGIYRGVFPRLTEQVEEENVRVPEMPNVRIPEMPNVRVPEMPSSRVLESARRAMSSVSSV